MDCGNRGGAGIGCAFRSGLYKREGAFPNYSCAIAGNREHAEHRAASVSRLHVCFRNRIAAVVGCHHRRGGDGKKENLSWHVPYKLCHSERSEESAVLRVSHKRGLLLVLSWHDNL